VPVFIRVQTMHYSPLSQHDAWYLRQAIVKDPGFSHIRLGIPGGAQLIVCECEGMNGRR